MYLSREEINRVLASTNLITKKESKRFPGLYVLKYKNKVFYDGLWNDDLVEFRGLVVDEENNVVVYPFTKIFNYGERGTTLPLNEEVVAVTKVNGFMACATPYSPKGTKSLRNLVSTTGSLDSPFVDIAEKYLRSFKLPEKFSFIFEICDPEDKHIIEESPGAYLIGVRDLRNQEMLNESMLDLWAQEIGAKRPKHYSCWFSQVLEDVKKVKHEGFVVHGKELSLKVKSPYYLTTKFLARKNPEKLFEMLENPYEMRKNVEEEYHNLIDYLCLNREFFTMLDEKSRIQYINEYLNVNLTA